MSDKFTGALEKCDALGSTPGGRRNDAIMAAHVAGKAARGRPSVANPYPHDPELHQIFEEGRRA